MGNCTKLKWNRRRLGLTQKQFAEKVGLNVGTIIKLEKDETAWGTIRSETADKIYQMYDSMASWQPERADKVIQEMHEENNIETVDEKPIVEPVVVREPVKKHDGLDKKDERTLILMEFIYEGLTQSKTHEEFVMNMNMMKRIVNQY